jgi:hypothetical protein
LRRRSRAAFLQRAGFSLVLRGLTRASRQSHAVFLSEHQTKSVAAVPSPLAGEGCSDVDPERSGEGAGRPTLTHSCLWLGRRRPLPQGEEGTIRRSARRAIISSRTVPLKRTPNKKLSDAVAAVPSPLAGEGCSDVDPERSGEGAGRPTLTHSCLWLGRRRPLPQGERAR